MGYWAHGGGEIVAGASTTRDFGVFAALDVRGVQKWQKRVSQVHLFLEVWRP